MNSEDSSAIQKGLGSARDREQRSAEIQLLGFYQLSSKLVCWILLYAAIVMLLFPLSLILFAIFKMHYSICYLFFMSKLENSEEATHILFRYENKKIFEKIVLIEGKRLIIFRELRYEVKPDHSISSLIYDHSLRIKELVQIIQRRNNISDDILNEISHLALHERSVKKRRELYGKNSHDIEGIKWYQYFGKVLTQTFNLIILGTTIIYILENYYALAAVLITAAFLMIWINYYLHYKKISKLGETARRQEGTIQALRIQNQSANFHRVNFDDLVPGDIVMVRDQIPCDCILLYQDIEVDQSNITGNYSRKYCLNQQNIREQDYLANSAHWLYESTSIPVLSANVIAMVINTGFTSKRGLSLRNLMIHEMKQSAFLKQAFIFYCQIAVVGLIVQFSLLKYMLSLQIDPAMVVYRFLDIITYSFPAPLPIFIQFAYICSYIRLNYIKGITSIDSTKNDQVGFIKNLFIDKTGTLTQKKHSLKFVKYQQNNAICEITKNQLKDKINNYNLTPQLRLIRYVFACCHSLRIDFMTQNTENHLDPVLFIASQGEISQSSSSESERRIQIKNRDNTTIIEYLAIRQFDYFSHFISVLVKIDSQISLNHQKKTEYYVFSKGSVDKIGIGRRNQVERLIGFDDINLRGYRSLLMSYKKVSSEEAQQIKQILQKKNDENNLDKLLKSSEILGLVVLENPIKAEAKKMVNWLRQIEITPRIITGDNIYTAISAAYNANFIPKGKIMYLIQGSNRNELKKVVCKDAKIQLEATGQRIDLNNLEETFDNSVYNNAVFAVDKDFVKQHLEHLRLQNILIYAGITPQLKADIIKHQKLSINKRIEEEANKMGFFRKRFYYYKETVAMLGDGFNDETAIKMADVGISIGNHNTALAPIFVIQKLTGIIPIIKEGKNISRQIVQISQYFGLYNAMSIIISFILLDDVSYFTGYQIIYKNFVVSILITMSLSFSTPHIKATKKFTCSSMLSIQNHLVFWGNLAINSCLITLAYVYFINSSEYVINPNRQVRQGQGWTGNTKCTTICFLMAIFYYTALPIFIYRSDPWKKPLVQNCFLLLIIIINFAFIVALSVILIYKDFDFLDLKHIDGDKIGIIFACMMLAILFSLLWNYTLTKQFESDPIVDSEDNYELEQSEKNNQK